MEVGGGLREYGRGTPSDFAEARTFDEPRIDHPFTDVDGTYPFIQLYTGDSLRPDRPRRGLAAERMTCPPVTNTRGAGLT